MRHWRLLAMVGLGLNFTRALAFGEAAPSIKFDQLQYDFGTTVNVSSVTGTFTFSNTGDADLHVGKPHPSCGCTKVQVHPEVLKPQEKGELVFTVDAGGIMGQAYKTILVPSDDPKQTNVILTVKLMVLRKFMVNPAQVNFGEVHPGTVSSTPATLQRHDGKKLVVTRIEDNGGPLHAEIQPGGSDHEIPIQIRVRATDKLGWGTESLRVFVDDMESPALLVPVYWRVVGPIAVDPEQLTWAVGNLHLATPEVRAKLLTRPISLRSTFPDQTLNVTNATTDLPGVTLEIATVQSGKVYSVTARMKEPPAANAKGEIKITTGLAAQPEVTVPVSVVVPKKE